MLTRSATSLPVGNGWLYEPKWDGFRALVYRDGERVYIMSRNGNDLTARFYDVAETARQILPKRCVIDGEPIVLLLGLYAEDGVLDHVGQSSVLSAPVAREAWRRLQPHLGGDSFADGRLPGYSRWQEQRPTEWISVDPVVVCEVAYTAVDNFRLRHGASFLRWREDRDPGDCW